MASHSDSITIPGVFTKNSPWKLYDQLIAGVPEDVQVTDYCVGTNWSYVNAECGCGVAITVSGGKPQPRSSNWLGKSLREVAALSKSWCFEEATLGIAALNAWYNRPEMIEDMEVSYDALVELPDGSTRKMDAFQLYMPHLRDRNVTIVGHFPHVERVLDVASNLVVLERNCRGELDTPDPACEYVMPQTDFAFVTGVTLINKTAPRLLELTRTATTIFVGPSVVMADCLYDFGIETLAGSVVADPEKAMFAVKNGRGQFFGEALQMLMAKRRGADSVVAFPTGVTYSDEEIQAPANHRRCCEEHHGRM